MIKFIGQKDSAENVSVFWNRIKQIFAPLNSPEFTGTPHAPTPASGDNTTRIATTAFVADALESVDALPSQTGQSGKFLTTDGTDASWAEVDALPSQTGKNGKYLMTNGSVASWEDVADEAIFWVTFETTTYAEITAAISAGKLPICVYSNKAYVYHSTNTGNIQLIAPVTLFGAISINYININYEDEWYAGSSSPLVSDDLDYYMQNSPALDGTPTAPTAASGTNTTQIATTAFVQAAVGSSQTGGNGFQSNLAAQSTLTNADYEKGWYWVVSTAGTYAGEACEVGDFVYAIADKGNAYSDSDFTAIQRNLDLVAITNAEIDTICAS